MQSFLKDFEADEYHTISINHINDISGIQIIYNSIEPISWTMKYEYISKIPKLFELCELNTILNTACKRHLFGIMKKSIRYLYCDSKIYIDKSTMNLKIVLKIVDKLFNDEEVLDLIFIVDKKN